MLYRVAFLIIGIIFIYSFQNVSAQSEVDKVQFIEEDFTKMKTLFNERVSLYKTKNQKFKKSFTDSILKLNKWASINGNSQQRLLASFYEFFAYDQLINNDSIIEKGIELLNNREFLTLPQSSITAHGVFVAYHRKGFFLKQLEIYPIVRKLNKLHNYNAQPKSYLPDHELAMIYFNLGNYEQARNHFTIQASHFIEQGNYFRAASEYNNIGLTFEKEDNRYKAIESYEKSLALINSELEGDVQFTARYKIHFRNVVQSNIATLSMRYGKYDQVKNAFIAELNSSKKIAEPRITVQAYTNLSEYYLLTNNVETALVYNDSAVNALKLLKLPAQVADIYELRSRILLLNQSLDLSQVFYYKATHIRDSIERSKRLHVFNEAAADFDLKSTQENLKTINNKLSQKETISTYQWIIIIVILLATFFLFYQYRKIKNSNKRITKKDKQLEKALLAKQTMLEEIHHRIKNNLQVVSGLLELKSLQVQDTALSQTMLDTQNYIHSMTYIHQHLYSQNVKEELDMQAYFEELGRMVISNHAHVKINLQVHATDIYLTSKIATPLGLITTELITNSMKHAFTTSGLINIVLHLHNGLYSFEYRDTGKGYDLEKETTDKQLGTNLIKLLAEELDATITEKIDDGYRIKMTFNYYDK